jgi:HEAT repeat protein
MTVVIDALHPSPLPGYLRRAIGVLILGITSSMVVLVASAQVAEYQSWVEALRDSEQRVSVAFLPPDIDGDSVGVLQVLVDAMEDPDPFVRRAAVAAIGETTLLPDSATPAVLNLFSDPNEDVRAHAVVAAGKLGLPAVPFLLDVVSGNTSDAQPLDASDACTLIDLPPGLAAISLGLVGPAATAPVVGALPDIDSSRRPLLRFALSQMGVPGALHLAEAFANPDPRVRETAVLVLSDLDDAATDAVAAFPELAAKLATLLMDESEAVRTAAARVLPLAAAGVRTDNAPPFVRGLLRALLVTQSPENQKQLIISLGILGPAAESALDLLTRFVEAGEPRVAMAAIEALEDIGLADSRVVDVLAGTVKGPGDETAIASALSLTRMGGSGLDALILISIDTRGETSPRAISIAALTTAAQSEQETLRYLRDRLGILEWLVQDESDAVRKESAELLRVIADRSAPGQVRPRIVHEEARLADVMTQTARPSVPDGTRRPDDNVLVTLRGELRSTDPSVRARVLKDITVAGRSAGTLGNDLLTLFVRAEIEDRLPLSRALVAVSPLESTTVPTLRDALKDEDISTRMLSIQLLASMGRAASPSTEDLREVVRGGDRILAGQAAEALLSIDPDEPPDAESLAALFDHAVAEVVQTGNEQLTAILNCVAPPTEMQWRMLTMLRDISAFPWPPPRPSSYDVLNRHIPSDVVITFGSVYDYLDQALSDAGYSHAALYEVGDGIAIVAPMERVEADGRPVHGPDRWLTRPSKPQSVREWVSRLFVSRPGEFRMIAVVVTADPALGVSGGEWDLLAAEDYGLGGARWLRDELKEEPLAGRRVVGLVYHFHRRPGALGEVLRPSSIAWVDHLVLSGILAGQAE